MSWKIVFPDGAIVYKKPNNTQLLMHGCVLKNNKKTAEKILAGQNKEVCAWILCDTIDFKPFPIKDQPKISFNPRIKAHWNLNNLDVDGCSFFQIASLKSELFLVSK